MAADRGVSTGTNGRALDENIGETAPGLSDDAVVPGELRPDEVGEGADEAVKRLKREGWTERSKPC